MLAAGNVALAVCAVSDLLVVAMIVSDLVTRRRVHASLVWGGLALIATQYLAGGGPPHRCGTCDRGWLQS